MIEAQPSADPGDVVSAVARREESLSRGVAAVLELEQNVADLKQLAADKRKQLRTAQKAAAGRSPNSAMRALDEVSRIEAVWKPTIRDALTASGEALKWSQKFKDVHRALERLPPVLEGMGSVRTRTGVLSSGSVADTEGHKQESSDRHCCRACRSHALAPACPLFPPGHPKQHQGRVYPPAGAACVLPCDGNARAPIVTPADGVLACEEVTRVLRPPHSYESCWTYLLAWTVGSSRVIEPPQSIAGPEVRQPRLRPNWGLAPARDLAHAAVLASDFSSVVCAAPHVVFPRFSVRFVCPSPAHELEEGAGARVPPVQEEYRGKGGQPRCDCLCLCWPMAAPALRDREIPTNLTLDLEFEQEEDRVEPTIAVVDAEGTPVSTHPALVAPPIHGTGGARAVVSSDEPLVTGPAGGGARDAAAAERPATRLTRVDGAQPLDEARSRIERQRAGSAEDDA